MDEVLVCEFTVRHKKISINVRIWLPTLHIFESSVKKPKTPDTDVHVSRVFHAFVRNTFAVLAIN